MKLYLSSYRIPTPDALLSLLGKEAREVQMAIIPNAGDYYSDRVRMIKARDVAGYLLQLGFQTEVVDLIDYTDASALKKKLEEFDAIFVNGGNTFCLRYQMKRSGFDQIIKDVLESGIVYIGESAGAVAAGTSLRDIELADEPEFAEETIWEGLRLTDRYILPHVGNIMFEAANNAARENHQNEPGFTELRDNEALVIDGEKSFLTYGEL